MTSWLLHQIPLEVGQSPKAIRGRVARKLGLRPTQVSALEVVRRSLDSRGRPRWICTLAVTLVKGATPRSGDARPAPEPWLLPSPVAPEHRNTPVVVVGAGPAGLTCAHVLAAAGLTVELVEQGAPVAERHAAVAGLMARGELDPVSNMCFGMGGAGTYSDGKLYTRKRDERLGWLLGQLAQLAEAPELLIDAHPHLGTDRLVPLLERWQQLLGELGVRFHFRSRVQSLLIEQGRAAGVVLDNGERIEGRAVVVAPGHSARGLWAQLAQQGVALEATPFAVGLRMEHPQEVVNRMAYGRWHEDERLPPAEYSLTAHGPRPCHSFCMCPGGTVVPTPTEPDGLVLNGMSGSRRGGPLANAAVIVAVRPEDLPAAQGDALAGVAFQRELEGAAYRVGGGGFRAPAQRLVDFMAQRASGSLPATSYHRGVTPARLERLLPSFVAEAMGAALAGWLRKHPLLASSEALLLGVESRPSSPVRLPRGRDCQSLSTPGLYPTGEGAGQASGITSCALDGMRVAEAIITAVHG